MFTVVRHKSGTGEIDVNFRLVWQKAMRIKHDLPAYNASINLRTECSERKRRRGQNKKKKSASL
jgi:hypothetical protein